MVRVCAKLKCWEPSERSSPISECRFFLVISCGPIFSLCRRRVEVEPTDPAETLYRRLESACVELFTQAWPLVRAGKAPRISQNGAPGTSHRMQDVERIDEIDLQATFKAQELIDLIRARTFPPYPGAYFRSGGRKVYLRLQLEYENEEGKKKNGARP